MDGRLTYIPVAERWRRDGPGLALSLLLHLLLLLAATWYIARRPVMQHAPHALPVEIVLAARTEAGAPGAKGPAVRAPRPQPQSAPEREGVSPRAVRQPEDELSAKLRALAHLRQPDTPLSAPVETGSGGGDGIGGGGSYALKDYVRSQILRRWLPDLSAPGARDMPVLVRLRLLASGAIESVAIVDQARLAHDKLFREMAFSARDAALLASPIALPPGRYPRATDLTIDLDPKSVLR